MGNAVPLRLCRDEAAATPVGRRRRPRNNAVADAGAAVPYYAAAPRRAAVTPRKLQRGDAEQGQEQEGTARAVRVSWASGDADAVGKAAAATAATVKIVLRRKDAEALVARLNAQGARERKARMAEIKGELRAGECCSGGGGASPASCRDAWKPRLAPIKEN
ncbi:unnamed protein product [Urochloa humidicola]